MGENFAMTIEFADGHCEQIPDGESAQAIADAAIPVIRRLEREHGKAVRVAPVGGRWEAVSPERAAALHAQGIETVNTSDMTYEEAMRAIGLGR